MKVKVVNDSLDDFNKEFKVRRMNYEQVIVNYTSKSGLGMFDIDDIEFISEGEIDDLLIVHRDLLKIKINRGISIFFYKFLMDQLESIFNEKLEKINLLKDVSKSANKRGIWEKEIILILNSKYPLKVLTSGQNFKRSNYKFNIKFLEESEFEDLCKVEIYKITKQIKLKERELSNYGLAIEQMRNREKNVGVEVLS